MIDYVETLRSLITDLRIGISLCTRLPFGPIAPVGDGDVARASWTFPIVGLIIGLTGAAIYALACRFRIPPEPAAVLPLAITVLLTGAMHEDGLCDTADGFGGGKTREQKLEIMRDSRIGTFGGCALALSLMLRWSALVALSEPRVVAIALVAAHAAARAGLPAFMRLIPPARPDGLSTSAGQPPWQSAAIAIGIGTLCLVLSFGLSGAIVTLLTLALLGLALAALTMKQVGGQTGDVLGALEQTGEAVVFLIAATIL
jgi:adenosylcobinamide-GDP ribazoletransferase